MKTKKLGEIFENIHQGLNIETCKDSIYSKKIHILQKNEIWFTDFVEKSSLSGELREEMVLNKEIEDKYYVKHFDIIISKQKPYKVLVNCHFISSQELYFNINDEDKVVIPNEFIILRNIKNHQFNPVYISNYLEKKGILDYIKQHNCILNKELTIEDIKNIEIPIIPMEKQIEIATYSDELNNNNISWKLATSVNNDWISESFK